MNPTTIMVADAAPRIQYSSSLSSDTEITIRGCNQKFVRLPEVEEPDTALRPTDQLKELIEVVSQQEAALSFHVIKNIQSLTLEEQTEEYILFSTITPVSLEDVEEGDTKLYFKLNVIEGEQPKALESLSKVLGIPYNYAKNSMFDLTQFNIEHAIRHMSSKELKQIVLMVSTETSFSYLDEVAVECSELFRVTADKGLKLDTTANAPLLYKEVLPSLADALYLTSALISESLGTSEVYGDDLYLQDFSLAYPEQRGDSHLVRILVGGDRGSIQLFEDVPEFIAGEHLYHLGFNISFDMRNNPKALYQAEMKVQPTVFREICSNGMVVEVPQSEIEERIQSVLEVKVQDFKTSILEEGITELTEAQYQEVEIMTQVIESELRESIQKEATVSICVNSIERTLSSRLEEHESPFDLNDSKEVAREFEGGATSMLSDMINYHLHDMGGTVKAELMSLTKSMDLEGRGEEFCSAVYSLGKRQGIPPNFSKALLMEYVSGDMSGDQTFKTAWDILQFITFIAQSLTPMQRIIVETNALSFASDLRDQFCGGDIKQPHMDKVLNDINTDLI